MINKITLYVIYQENYPAFLRRIALRRFMRTQLNAKSIPVYRHSVNSFLISVRLCFLVRLPNLLFKVGQK